MTDYYTLGPGTLEFGETGSPTDYAMQVSACTVEPDSERDDDLNLLSGGVLEGETTNTAALTGTAVQDLAASGFTAYTWAHKGERVPVTFTPNTARGATVVGEVIIVPLAVGGDAKTRPTSDFSFDFAEFPEFTPSTDPAP